MYKAERRRPYCDDPAHNVLAILSKENLDRKSRVKIVFEEPLPRFGDRKVMAGIIQDYVGGFSLKRPNGKILPIPWSAIRDVRHGTSARGRKSREV